MNSSSAANSGVLNSDRRDPTRDADWHDIAEQWSIRPDTCYLNHGSFGISPEVVRASRRRWIDKLDCQPMDFYLRQLEPAFHSTRESLAAFLETKPTNLAFVENATYGMNMVANSFPLDAGDEILLTDQEYGAVKRIWERQANANGASVRYANIEFPYTSVERIIENIFSVVNSSTRLLVVSHIVSETGTILPVDSICKRAKEIGLPVCVDGPHAPAHVPLNLEELGCDFYTASCHKWLCAPLGTGFLFVDPIWQEQVGPLVQSWGRLNPNQPETWDEEMIWMGTRDPSAFFSISSAIDFIQSVGLNNFRERTHCLARHALEQLLELFQTDPIYPLVDSDHPNGSWFGSMCELPLPARLSDERIQSLQHRLWHEHGIEVPVFEVGGKPFLRVSFHLYNSFSDIDKLISALRQLDCQG